jgi:hypothetical protein
MERPMCVECIAAKSALPAAETQRYHQEIGKGMDVRIEEGRCRTCGEPRPVFSLSRLPSPTITSERNRTPQVCIERTRDSRRAALHVQIAA